MAQNLAPIGKRSVTGVQNEEDTNRSLLEFQSPTVALIAQPAPPFAHYSTYIIASMVVAFLIVAGTMPIDRVVTASGKVTTQSSNILVQPLETSIVRSIDVSVGQRVHTGDLLARLDPTFAGADQAAAMKLMVSLQAEVNRLTAEAAEKPYASDGTPDSQLQAAIFAQRQAERAYKIENYAQKISGLDVVYRKAQAEVGIYGERAGYADTLLRSRQDLERQGVGSKLNTLQAKDSAAEAHRLLDQSKAAAISAKRDLDAMIAERDGVIQQARGQTSQELSDAGRKLADAKEQLAKAQKRRDLVEIRADRDAFVLAVANVSVGSVLNPAQPFLTLVPNDAVMEVDGAIPASDVGFVRVGDSVVLKFGAYEFREHGYAEGSVRTIAPDSQSNPTDNTDGGKFAPQESKIDSVPLGAEVYRVKISIDTLKMYNLPQDFRLQPGLAVTGDVKVGKRTMLSYMLGRFAPMLTEGMREP